VLAWTSVGLKFPNEKFTINFYLTNFLLLIKSMSLVKISHCWGKWMEMEIIMISEGSQTQREIVCFPHKQNLVF
jgi:hypothetical protein